MDIQHVKTLLNLAASRLESRNIREDREIADLLRQAERALSGREEPVSAAIDHNQGWAPRAAGKGFDTSSLSEDIE